MSKKNKIILIIIIFIFIFYCFLENNLFLELKSMDTEKNPITLKFYKRRFSKYSNKVKILSKEGEKTKKYRGKNKINIWKVFSSDLDGDGIDEVILGVYKKAPHHKVMAKRIFMYNVNDLELIAKYRASRLSLPFDDFIIFDLDNDGQGEIISIERRDNSKLLAFYKYNNFKLHRLYISRFYKDIENLRVDKEIKFVKVIVDGSEKEVVLKNGGLELK